MNILRESLEGDGEIKLLMDNLDILRYFKGEERTLLGDMVEALRSWGKYNPGMTDLSPFLTDATTVIEGELSREILDYAKETGEFPVDMDEFLHTQPEEVRFLYNNGQKMRDIITRAAIQFIHDTDLSIEDTDINNIFKQLGKRAYQFALRGPFLKDAQDRKFNR